MGAPLPFGPWLAVLTFTLVLILNCTLWLARRHKTASSGARRAQLTAEVTLLRREAAKLNTPATYARCAKLQRLANAKDKELAELSAGPAVPGVADRLIVLCPAVKMLLACAATLLLWDSPVAQLVPRSLASPLGRLLAFPKGSDLSSYGLIAITPWLLIVDSATDAISKAVFPAPTPAQLAGPAPELEALTREAEAGGGRIRPVSRAAAAASVAAGN
ncbi:hypothetical protein HYH03_014158 [Edaphochlamys debaryana]|uniref:Uncharacterized protein n=1 Tax=Edaphochlamys debaryana TaxID=47281 RepID=A0A836BSF2_9CHLO|nr:hypothetical protein HYH03_014158 [Edaphochlamys debaryana]|eukprot:KAG2487180.1 hypothetical protein HYH03_014158 [Edaphochlamys debaryana]